MALRRLLIASLLALTLGGLAAAQELARLLPEETFFALGMEGLSEASGQLEPFRAEFERLDVAGALAPVFAGASDMTGGAMTGGAMTGGSIPTEVTDTLESLATLEVLGQEAWIGVSAASFSPLPALTLITRVSPEALERVRELVEGGRGAQRLEESGYTFYQTRIQGMEPVQVVVYTLADDLLALSTNPDELRGVLRRLSGSDEPSFASSEGYSETLETLEAGNFYGFLNYARIAEVAAPYAQNLGFDRLVTRLSQALTTAGAAGGVARLTEDALVGEGFQTVNEEGGDRTLYALLTSETPADTETLSRVPREALSYSVNAVNLSNWYNYLNELALTVPELGGDLDSLLLSITGVNLRETLFNWTGEQVVTVTTGLGEVVEPGVPSQNLLGEVVYLIEATNESAAQRGLSTLFQNVSQSVSALSDPQGGGEPVEAQREEVAGVAVERFDITDGLSLSYAVSEGYALIATSQDAMRSVLEAQEAGGLEAAVLGGVPEGASAVSYTDTEATFQGLAQQLGSQVQLAAGMGGASGLDFEAVERASSTLEEYLRFIASRLGTGTGYSERSAEGIRTRSETEVDWQE